MERLVAQIELVATGVALLHGGDMLLLETLVVAAVLPGVLRVDARAPQSCHH